MERPRIKCSSSRFRTLMGGVCDACVDSYCSCVPNAQVPNFPQAEAISGRGTAAEQGWDAGECIVHSHCSFCSRSLDDSIYGQQERSVKRKLAKIGLHGDKDDREPLPKKGNGDTTGCYHGYPNHGKHDGYRHNNDDHGGHGDHHHGEDELGYLREALQLERETVNRLYAELEMERNAAEIAAVEAIAKILRLQDEKAAIQREAREFELIVEARIIHDEQAIERLNGIVVEQEEQRVALEREVQMFKSIEDGQLRGATTGGGLHGDGGGSTRNHGRSQMDIDEDRVTTGATATSSVHDVYEVPPPTQYYGDAGGRYDDFDGRRRGYHDRRGNPEPMTGRGYVQPQRPAARHDGDLATELRRLNSRLQALEAEREFNSGGFSSKGGGAAAAAASGVNEMEILEEISQQLRHFQALERKQDDIKDLPDASFVFSFKGIFSFNGLRQSLHSHINRLACMFLKHTDAAGLSYGENHVGLSHLLENSRKNRAVPCITRGIKVDQAPSFAQQQQGSSWPVDARGRSETAFGGWDY